MAGDWIKMRIDLSEDPAVIAMGEELQVAETHVVGMLHRAWGWADKQSRNGHAKSVTLSWLDRYIGATGFAQALVNVGWLRVDEGLRFPNFDRHNGDSAKKRASATERKRAERGRHTEVADMSREKCDKSVTREEKRREDKPILTQAGFERFWATYPKKLSKGQAEKAWLKISPDEQFLERIVSAVERAKSRSDWRKDSGQFIPHPATWLNAKGWEDSAIIELPEQIRRVAV